MIEDLDGGDPLADADGRPEIVEWRLHETGDVGAGEVIVLGGRETLGDRLRLWVESHPGRVRAGWVLLGAAAVVFLAVAGALYLRGPQPPDVVATSAPTPGDSDQGARWDSGTDGRPSSSPIIAVPAQLVLAATGGGGKTTATVLGLTGPGLTAPTPQPVDLIPGQAQSAALDTGVDCAHVPWPVPADAYRLGLRFTQDGRSNTGDVPAGDLGRRFTQAVRVACGSWLANQDLTVTQVAVTPDLSQPQAGLTVTVTNHGTHPARLTPFPSSYLHLTLGDTPTSGSDTTTAVVVAPGTHTLTATLYLDNCATDSGGPPPFTGDPVTTSWEAMGLIATEDLTPAPNPGQGVQFVFSPGVVMTGQAKTAMTTALAALCAGPTSTTDVTTILHTDQVRWNERRRELSLPLTVRIPDAHIRGARLTNIPDDPQSVSLLTPSGVLYPADPAGQQINLTLTYQIGVQVPCGDDLSLTLPAPTFLLDIPTATGARTVPMAIQLPGIRPPATLRAMVPTCAQP